MTDLSKTIAPKSDQLNADDLIGKSLTIKVTKVSGIEDAEAQPIAIHFEGDNRKPYKPCKSMRRVLVRVWGNDGNQYAGRSMTLYRDEGVLFGGIAVGGIRISHLSHIDKEVTMALTASRASRKPFTVKPLIISDESTISASSLADEATKFADEIKLADTPEKLDMLIPRLQEISIKLEKSPKWKKALVDLMDSQRTKVDPGHVLGAG